MSRQPIPPSIAAIERPVQKLWTFYVLKAIASTVGIFVVFPLLYKDAGLGDHNHRDEEHPDVLAEAQSVLSEARALRAVVSQSR